MRLRMRFWLFVARAPLSLKIEEKSLSPDFIRAVVFSSPSCKAGMLSVVSLPVNLCFFLRGEYEGECLAFVWDLRGCLFVFEGCRLPGDGGVAFV